MGKRETSAGGSDAEKRACLDSFVLLHPLRLEAPARAQTVGPWLGEEHGMFKSQLLTVSGEF